MNGRIEPKGLIGLCALLCLLLFACGPIAEPSLEVGRLYVIDDGGGGFRPAKLIAFDSTVVHLRLYGNVLPFRPDTLVADTLSLNRQPGGPPTYKHFPVSRTLFRRWSPEPVGFDTVRPEEWRLVEEWKMNAGGVVGESL